jgi:hypothetical protein
MTFTFQAIGALLWDDSEMYATNRTGWYGFGFWLGIGLFGGAVKATVKNI